MLSVVFAAQHPVERSLQFQSMIAILDVFVLSDGLGNEFWTLGLDDHKATHAQRADRALRTVAHLAESANDSLTIVSGSFGKRAANFAPALIHALKHCDSASNVSRHHFDVVSLVDQPQSPVIAIGPNQETRRRAAKLALTCRLLFERTISCLLYTSPSPRD